MRFEVTRVLDSIERRLSTDPSVARAVVDLAPITKYVELDGGRAVSVLRLGLVIDALGARLSDPGAKVYVVVDKALISSLELTSNEKMTLRRWADDGLVEVVSEVDDRALEVSAYTGLPVLSRDDYARFADRHPWIAGAPERFLIPVPGMGGAALMTRPGGPGQVSMPGQPGQPGPAGPTGPVLDQQTTAILGRYWQCPEPGCASFGPANREAQPPPRIRGGRPLCPRHDQPLTDAGQRQRSVPMVILIGGQERGRFGVPADRPVVVGRSPNDPNGVRLGELLDDDAVQWVSRSHVRLELSGNAIALTDTSTNGTIVLARPGPEAAPTTLHLAQGEQRVLGDWDVIQLHEGVELARGDRQLPTDAGDAVPVMAEAPTIAIRVPGQQG